MSPKKPKPGATFPAPNLPPPPTDTQHTSQGTAKIRRQKGPK